MESMYSLEQLCELLSISAATGRNWLRLGKLTATCYQNSQPFFSHSYGTKLQQQLSSKENKKLKSRRNKGFSTDFSMYTAYLCNETAEQELLACMEQITAYFPSSSPLPDYLIHACLTEAALQLLANQHDPEAAHPHLLKQYLLEDASRFPALLHWLLAPFLTHKKRILSLLNENPEVFSFTFSYRKDEDLLGLLYQSLQTAGTKQKRGAFFTPRPLAEQLLTLIPSDNSHTYLDPSCGTGGFLLPLAHQVNPSQLYGCDIDAISIAIIRINFVLHQHCYDQSYLTSHFTCKNFLTGQQDLKTYTHILGNPPWGATFSKQERARLQQLFPSFTGNKPESACLFFEKSLSMLSQHGTVTFLLPEALLQAKKHLPWRQLLGKECTLTALYYLGNAFSGIQCPCILLSAQKAPHPSATDTLRCQGASIVTPEKSFSIETERNLPPQQLSLLADDREYVLLEKIRQAPDCISLKDHAKFGLGIVTGNNRQQLFSTPGSNREPILTGKDIFQFHTKPATHYLHYDKSVLQQTASYEDYHAPAKLVYRFIASRPIVALETQQQLLLNSCNFFTLTSNILEPNYLTALLNSPVIAFYFQLQFPTIKILRSQLEQLPLLVPSQKIQKQISAWVEEWNHLKSDTKKEQIRRQINHSISKLYQLTKVEETMISHYDVPFYQ